MPIGRLHVCAELSLLLLHLRSKVLDLVAELGFRNGEKFVFLFLHVVLDVLYELLEELVVLLVRRLQLAEVIVAMLLCDRT
jgi:hypothetical protein